MNFFEEQDRARRTTRWLLVIYAAATALIVAGVTLIVGAALYLFGTPGEMPERSVLVAVAVLAVLLIFGATLYRTAALSAGGSRVATDMGGTPVPPDVRDPLKRRLRNVVEEMSIASGVPVPDIYILESEPGINAFAAGYTPGDAAIAVTRGALEVLNRDELQGVIAHEFSHVMNGDMRINIRMMGVLFGIMVLSLIGRLILRGGFHRGVVRSRRSRSVPVVLLIGAGLTILGWVGVLMARCIKAAVSRQREMLADASAVQFTRQSEGLAGALKKIGGYTDKSYIRNVDPEEVSHMLFARGARRLTSLFATHPPLVRRIQALDPSFREDDFRPVRPRAEGGAAVPGTASLAGSGQGGGTGAAAGLPAASLAGTIGNPDSSQIAFARQLRETMPADLYDAAHSPEFSFLLTLALLLDRSGGPVERQLNLLGEQLGRERASRVQSFYDLLRDAGPEYSLPLLEISFPALKHRPAGQLEFLVGLIRRLIDIGDQEDLFEFCFYRVLLANLDQATDPSRSGRGKPVSRKAARRAAIRLLKAVAHFGHADEAVRDGAWRAGLAALGPWASTGLTAQPPDRPTIGELDSNLDVLRRVDLSGRKTIVEALTVTVAHDRRMTVTESELLRAICAGLDCPLPPFVRETPVSTAEQRTAGTSRRTQEMPG